MKKSIFFLKKLTLAEVGGTKTHEKYVRLPNDFDYESFFPGLAKDNGTVIQVDFSAKNKTVGHSSDREVALKFVFYAHSNQEKRIPSLGGVFAAHNIEADDVVCLESCTDNGTTTFYITFAKSSVASLVPAAVTYSIITDDDGIVREKGTAPTKEETALDTQEYSYISAIRTKPFLILGGFSGTGKSQKVKELAFATCPCDGVLNTSETSPAQVQHRTAIFR